MARIRGVIGTVDVKELDPNELRCRGANSSDVPMLSAVIDKAFAKRGFAGSGTSLAISIEKLSNIVLIYREKGGAQQILGVCPIREYPCHFGPTTLIAGGFSLVAVDPAYQRRGVGQKMMVCAEEHMYHHGFDIALLFTGSPGFYRHTGWIQAVDAPFCELSIEVFGSQQEALDSSFDFRWLQDSDVAGVTRLYEDFNKERPLTRVRSEAWWTQRIKRQGERRRFLGAFYGGTLLGYFGLEYPDVDEPRIDVVEYATAIGTSTNQEDRILDALLRHLYTIAGGKGYHLIATPLPATYPLSRRFRTAGAIIKDGWWSSLMILIINVPAFISKLIMFQERLIVPRVNREYLTNIVDFNIGLAVEDPRETNPIIVHYMKEGMSLSVYVGSTEIKGDVVPITRQQLALVMFGNYTLRLLVECGLWVCPDKWVDQLGLFFPKTDGMVYQRDHF